MGKMKKRIAVIGTVSALAIGGGLAWASWTSDGSGTAAAQAGQAAGLSVATSPKPQVNGNLSPNIDPLGITLTVTNANSYKVKITKIKLTKITVTGFEPDGTTADAGTTCSGSTASGSAPLTSANAGNTGIQLTSDGASDANPFEYTLTADLVLNAKGSGSATPVQVTIPAAVIMQTTSDNGCQGDKFDLDFTVTGESVA